MAPLSTVTVVHNDVGANEICWVPTAQSPFAPMAPLTMVSFAQLEPLAPMAIAPMAQNQMVPSPFATMARQWCNWRPTDLIGANVSVHHYHYRQWRWLAPTMTPLALIGANYHNWRQWKVVRWCHGDANDFSFTKLFYGIAKICLCFSPLYSY